MLRLCHAALPLVLLTVATAAAQDEQPRLSDLIPSITVTGTGEVQVEPDRAQIHVGVVTQAESAAGAVEANNQAMQQLLDALKQHGVEANDIQTSNFSISPQHDYDQQGRHPPQIVGYQVTNQVQVKVRDLARLGALLDLVVQQGANQVQGIDFQVSDQSQRKDEARRKALDDARRKAELYASAAGARVGRPLLIQESAPDGPQPLAVRHMALQAEGAVPVASGEQTLAVTVSVTYRLKANKQP